MNFGIGLSLFIENKSFTNFDWNFMDVIGGFKQITPL